MNTITELRKAYDEQFDRQFRENVIKHLSESMNVHPEVAELILSQYTFTVRNFA